MCSFIPAFDGIDEDFDNDSDISFVECDDDEIDVMINEKLKQFTNPFRWHTKDENFDILCFYCSQIQTLKIPLVIKQLILKYFDCSLSSKITIKPQKQLQFADQNKDAIIHQFSKPFVIEKSIKLQCAVTMENNSANFICAILSIPKHITQISIEYKFCCKETYNEWININNINNSYNNFSSLISYSNSNIFNKKCIDTICWPSGYMKLDEITNVEQLTFGFDIKLLDIKTHDVGNDDLVKISQVNDVLLSSPTKLSSVSDSKIYPTMSECESNSDYDLDFDESIPPQYSYSNALFSLCN